WNFKGVDPKDWCPQRVHDALDVVLRGLPPVALLVEYAYMAQVFPEPKRHGVACLVDTHDLFFRRLAFYKAKRMQPDWFMITKDVEQRLLGLADWVLAIQPREAETLRGMVEPDRVIE